jgi:hypothetical protein
MIILLKLLTDKTDQYSIIMKVASIKKITTRASLINWLDTLPTEISNETFSMILFLYQNCELKYVLWREGYGFKFFK